jgi:hypothetical protein
MPGAFAHGIDNVPGDVSELADEHDLGSMAKCDGVLLYGRALFVFADALVFADHVSWLIQTTKEISTNAYCIRPSAY